MVYRISKGMEQGIGKKEARPSRETLPCIMKKLHKNSLDLQI